MYKQPQLSIGLTVYTSLIVCFFTYNFINYPSFYFSLGNKKPRQDNLTGRFIIWRLTMTYSHMGTPTLPSAMHRFTSEFGMGSGGTNALWSSNNSLWFPVVLSIQSFNFIRNLLPNSEKQVFSFMQFSINALSFIQFVVL